VSAAQALVPLKDLVQAKTRLAGLLRPSERRALAQAMVQDVLSVLSAHPEVGPVTLLSDDPGADLLAAKYGCNCLAERELGASGLNALLEEAVTRLAPGAGQPVLVLHGDLPLLGRDDITAVLALQRHRGGVVIGCDREGTGTNLLAFEAGCAVPFRFGPDSCARHLAAAVTAGVTARVLQRPGIALDIDGPSDMAVLLEALDGGETGETAALLWGTGLGARLALALETLAPGAHGRTRQC
jgi:2-phospho-L-lactate guanylyltransferase